VANPRRVLVLVVGVAVAAGLVGVEPTDGGDHEAGDRVMVGAA
jgi:hypothetical protein